MRVAASFFASQRNVEVDAFLQQINVWVPEWLVTGLTVAVLVSFLIRLMAFESTRNTESVLDKDRTFHEQRQDIS